MKTLKFHIILVLLSVLWNFSYAQNYINYTEKDGLASNFVYRMRQDHKGFMWFLTDKGISKFDGKAFKNFTVKDGLPVNDIWNMRITPNDRIWFFTRADALGYIENDRVYSFKSDQGAMLNPNNKIFQSGNDISFTSRLSQYHFVDSIWQSSKIYERRVKLLNREMFLVTDPLVEDDRIEDEEGELLLTLKKRPTDYNYCQFNDSLLVKIYNSDFEIVNLNTYKAVYGKTPFLEKNVNPSANGRSWFNLANDRLQLSGTNWLMTFDDEFNTKEIFEIPSSLNSTHNFQDKDGFIWISTSGKGTFKLPIAYNDITSLFEGEPIRKIIKMDAAVYVAVEGDGIYSLQDNEPKLVFKEKLRLYSVAKIENITYYNFRFHLIIEKEGTFKKIDNSGYHFSKTLVPYQRYFFTEGFSDLHRFDEKFIDKTVYDKYPHYQGLFKQNDSLFSFSHKQLLFYDIETEKFIEYKQERIQQKLLTNEGNCDQNYIGTEGDGLYLFSEGKLQKLIKNDTAVISQISVENHRSIWAISEGVLLHYYQDNLGEFKVERLNQINGLPTHNLTTVLVYKGQLYLGSTSGLNIIDKEVIRSASNFTPYVKSITLNEKKVNNDTVAYQYDENINLKVNFGSINFFDPENTSFEYRLNPLQQKWTTTESGEVNLFNLQPNDYRLDLRVSHNGKEKIKSVPLFVVANWWQTLVFRLGLLLLALALAYYGIWMYGKNIRLKRNKKIIQEGQRVQLELGALRAQMNPHFVHNSLNAIQYYIQRNEVNLSEEYLAKFATLIRLFFEYSRRRAICIKNEILLLQNYLDIEKLRFEDELKSEVTVDDKIEIEEQLIPSMILQPIVENAINHGLFHKVGSGKVSVHFGYIDPTTFEVIIKDDGIGIKKAKKIYKDSSIKYQAKSTNVLQERFNLLKASKEWNVDYNIEDRSIIDGTSGTIVTLVFNQLNAL